MHDEVQSQLDRARELYQELVTECERRKNEKQVHHRTLNLAVEVLAKLRGILDHVALAVFERTVQAKQKLARKKLKVYFPIADDEQSFRSQLRRSKMVTIETDDSQIFQLLRGTQPFASSGNRWLAILRDLSNEGKHVRLVRQSRRVSKRTTVTGPGGSVSWGPGVTFGEGVSVMGAPIDPHRQDIVPTPGVTSKTEMRVSFEFASNGENVLGFLANAIDRVETLTKELLANLPS